MYTVGMDESGEDMIKKANSWMNEHSRPSYEALADLARSETPEAYEILRELALQYDIPCDDSTPLLELAAKISNVIGKNSDESNY